MEELAILEKGSAVTTTYNKKEQELPELIDPKNIIIPSRVADGLDGWKCEIVKEATASIQSNMIVMGHCLASTAKSLHQLKSLIPRSNWIAFS